MATAVSSFILSYGLYEKSFRQTTLNGQLVSQLQFSFAPVDGRRTPSFMAWKEEKLIRGKLHTDRVSPRPS